MDVSEDLELDSLMELLNDASETQPDVNVSLSDSPLKEILVNSSNESADLENADQHKIIKDVSVDLFSFENQELNEKLSLLTSEKKSEIHTGETDSSDDENKPCLSESGMSIKRKLAKAMNYHHNHTRRIINTWKDNAEVSNLVNQPLQITKCAKKSVISGNPEDILAKNLSVSINDKKRACTGNSVATENYSGIRIINPLVSFDVMQQRMQGRKMVKMSFIKNFMRGGDIDGDWVTIGVVVRKLPPKTTKAGKSFSIWKMTDLHNCDKIISFFLFGAAHSEHWKTTVGSVVGILNPSILSDNNDGELSVSVDHPGKIMHIGTSRDFGNCKSRTKSGDPCKMIVNKSQCEYCPYHVKKEYKKFSSNRSEIQASYSSQEPSFKNKVLKGQNFFYGGQTFVSSNGPKLKASKPTSSKDRLTLSNLTLKRKAEAVENVEKDKAVKKLAEIYGPEVSKVAEKNSEFINNQLAFPTVGSRNLLCHLMKDKIKKEDVKLMRPKEFLKIRENMMKSNFSIKSHNRTKSDSEILKNLMPELGKGLSPGNDITLDFSLRKAYNALTPQDFAKLKAIRKIQDKGPIKQKDPNSVKISQERLVRVKTSLQKTTEDKDEKIPQEVNTASGNKLSGIDLNSEKLKEILNRKSSHAHEVEMAETEKEEMYFNRLEKKEQMEEKMLSTTELVCDVVSCKKCKYTAHSATDLCKEKNHPLKCHKAIKRFFRCKTCNNRTYSFTRFPSKACRFCGGSNFERTGIWKARSGPKLESEILRISADQPCDLNSL